MSSRKRNQHVSQGGKASRRGDTGETAHRKKGADVLQGRPLNDAVLASLSKLTDEERALREAVRNDFRRRLEEVIARTEREHHEEIARDEAEAQAEEDRNAEAWLELEEARLERLKA